MHRKLVANYFTRTMLMPMAVSWLGPNSHEHQATLEFWSNPVSIKIQTVRTVGLAVSLYQMCDLWLTL